MKDTKTLSLYVRHKCTTKKSHPVYGNAILMLKFTNEENMKQAD